LRYRFDNHGRSPAWIKAISISAGVAQELTGDPDYGETTPRRFVIAPKGWYGTVEDAVMEIPSDFVVDIFLNGAKVFVFGKLVYEDVFREEHATRFAYSLILEGDETGRFIPDGPDSYWGYT
jgi:hypothetical protein